MTAARYGVDTNVLVYVHMPALAGHEVVGAALTAFVRRPGTSLVLSPLVLHELVHVITDPRRFDPPVPMSEAVALAGGYLRRTNVTCVDATGTAMELALDLLARHRLGRKRVFDALLAATLLVNGVDTLITCNPDDFRMFDDLTVLDPRTDVL